MQFYAQIPMQDWFPHIQKQAILGHQLGILQFNLVLTLSSRRQHQTPKVNGSVLYDCPPFRCQLPPVHLTHQPRLGRSSKALLGFDLLERLTELREAAGSL